MLFAVVKFGCFCRCYLRLLLLVSFNRDMFKSWDNSSSLQITDHTFWYASPRLCTLWNEQPSSSTSSHLWLLSFSFCFRDFKFLYCISSLITPSLFHSQLKTYLFCKSFSPKPLFSSSGLTPQFSDCFLSSHWLKWLCLSVASDQFTYASVSWPSTLVFIWKASCTSHDEIYGAVIMAQNPLWEFTQFIWWMPGGRQHSDKSQPTGAVCLRHLLSLLTPKADTHCTIPRRIEGWVDLGNAERV